jgi:hypothetical protein
LLSIFQKETFDQPVVHVLDGRFAHGLIYDGAPTLIHGDLQHNMPLRGAVCAMEQSASFATACL